VTTATLDSVFSAVSDPTRRAILARLTKGDATVSTLAAPFDMSLPAVSRHLKVLEQAGLVARAREGKWRPSRLEASPIKEVAEWAGGYKRFWEASLNKLDEVLEDMKSKEKKSGEHD